MKTSTYENFCEKPQVARMFVDFFLSTCKFYRYIELFEVVGWIEILLLTADYGT